MFKQYRDTDIDPLNVDVDLCRANVGTKELYPYQKIVRDYLLAETPYRGLLVYHGLGSGKTCSAIAVAESLLSTKRIFVFAPASLLTNFRNEIRTCGDPIYRLDQHWEVRPIRSDDDRAQAKALGLSDGFLDKHMRFFATIPDRVSNFRDLPFDVQKGISDQIDDVISQRFTLIAYNGINKTNADTLLPDERMFDNSVIIIDESHDFISTVVGESVLKTRLYEWMLHARDAKVVCLSGTPMLNKPNELAYLMNLVRGPLTTIGIPAAEAISWDEGLMTAWFRSLPDVDTISYNSVKKVILLTRNPPHFQSVYNEKNERIAVQYNADLPYEPDPRAWVDTWRGKFAREFGGVTLASSEQLTVVDEECLPTDYETFMNTFIDGLKVKNPLLFQRRIQGLVSYFKGADERLLPKRIDDEHMLQKIPMSDEQFNRYLDVRWQEIQQDSRRGRMKNALNEDMGTYRVKSRLACNFAIPPEFLAQTEDDTPELEKPQVLEAIRAQSQRFLTPETLPQFSPKFATLLRMVKSAIGTGPAYHNQLIYSYYRTLEGTGLFGAILEANGFQRYRLSKEQGVWQEDPTMQAGVPAYATFTGAEDDVERELYRQIFNQKYEASFPQSLKDSIKEKRLCIFMISKAGAQGITLTNVRDVHIMEGHWNPALIDQVIGRAIRICSHATLPLAERTVRVHWYLTVFSKEQLTTSEGNNIVPIRRNDMVLKRYEGDPVETFMTSDEFVYEIAYEKSRITHNLTHLLKQSAIDCEIHRALHSREQPVIQCMRFDTGVKPEDLAFHPNLRSDERDELYMRNVQRRRRRLQRVRVKGLVLLYDPDSKEIFDAPAFEDNERLLKIGDRVSENEIRWFT
jgi:hypothetical protein